MRNGSESVLRKVLTVLVFLSLALSGMPTVTLAEGTDTDYLASDLVFETVTSYGVDEHEVLPDTDDVAEVLDGSAGNDGIADASESIDLAGEEEPSASPEGPGSGESTAPDMTDGKEGSHAEDMSEVDEASDVPESSADAEVGEESALSLSAQSDASMFDAYKSVLLQAQNGQGVFRENYENHGGENDKYWLSEMEYTLFDIDSNGVPELIVHNGYITAYMRNDYFAFCDGQAVHLGIGDGKYPSWYATPAGQLLSTYYRQGVSIVWLMSISDGTISGTQVFKHSDFSSNDSEMRAYLVANDATELETSPTTDYALLQRICDECASVGLGTKVYGTALDGSVSLDITSSSSIDTTWSDSWFVNGHGGYHYEHSLGRALSVLADAAYERGCLEGDLRKLGFVSLKSYYPADDGGYSTDWDECAYAFGIKTTEDPSTGRKVPIVAVVVRGTHDGGEWLSNFNVANGSPSKPPSDHEAFSRCRDRVLTALRLWADTFERDELDWENARVFITGHSRGAAVAGLLASAFDDGEKIAGHSVSPNNVYAYTFASPTTSKWGRNSYVYDNIFNIVNAEDLVPKLPLGFWGYQRLGQTFVLPSKTNTGVSRYRSLKSEMDSVFRSIMGGASYKSYPLGSATARLVASEVGRGIPTVGALYDVGRWKLIGIGLSPHTLIETIIQGHMMDGDKAMANLAIADLARQMPVAAPLILANLGIDSSLGWASQRAWTPDHVWDGHRGETYIAWMWALDGTDDFASTHTGLMVACPVDVRVYAPDGTLVAEIVDGEVNESLLDGGLAAWVDGDAKYVDLPDEDAYRVELTPYGDGEMDVVLAHCGATDEVAEQVGYEDLALESGKAYELTTTGEASEEATIVNETNLAAPGLEKVEPDYALSGEELDAITLSVTVEGSGTVICPESATRGDYVTARAIAAEGSTFEGWYEGGNLVSGEPDYQFCVVADRSLEARFSSTAVASGTSGTCVWEIDSEGALVVKPAEGGEGTLGSWSTFPTVPWHEHIESITSARFEGTVHAETCCCMFSGCSSLKSVNLAGLETSGVTDMSSVFRGCTSLKSLDLSSWETSSVTDVSYMFYQCSSLASLDLSGWVMSSAINMESMFSGCSSLESIDVADWDVSSATDMCGLFAYCSSLTLLDVSNWDTSAVVDAGSIFRGCSALATLDVSRWDTSSMTYAGELFKDCSSLVSLDVRDWDTSSVQNMNQTFRGCSALASLDISAWDTSQVRNMGSMFYRCSSLSSLDVSRWDTSSLTNARYVFSGCSSIEVLNLSDWDTSSVNDMDSMFSACSMLKEVDLSGWDTSSVDNMEFLFYNCSSLKSLDLSGWDTASVTCMLNMFRGCTSLERIDLSGWDTSAATNTKLMFEDCSHLAEVRVGERVTASVLAELPSSEVSGHSDWWSEADRAWYSVEQIAASRAGVADTYLKEEGSPLPDGWHTFADGAKGYVKNGSLVKGWLDLNGGKYWFDLETGKMATGWTDLVVDGKQMRYYFRPSGNLARAAWADIDGKKYYFRPSGNMATGWASIANDNGESRVYWFDESGQMVTGWRDVVNDEGKTNHYYFRASGAMATGWAEIDGEHFYFRPSGNMATGFTDVTDDAYKRYFDESGKMLTGWQQIGGNTYYFRSSGAMQTGTATIGGKSYAFTDKGVLVG